MFTLEWGSAERLFEYGVDRGVLAVPGHPVVTWEGLVNVTESPEGAEPQTTYLDGIKIVNYNRRTDYSAKLDALYSPPEFDECDGTLEVSDSIYATNNPGKPFDFSYRSRVGTRDYKLHLVYNALASPTSRNYSTQESNINPTLLSWDITTSPNVRSGGVNAHFVLDTRKSRYGVVRTVENVLYGVDGKAPKFPSLSELVAIVAGVPKVTITDLGNGQWRIDAPDSVSKVVNSAQGLFNIDWAGLDILDDSTFNIRE